MRWFNQIVAYFDNRTTSVAVVRVAFRKKGINNKLKLIKRSAYGLTNFNNFIIRCLLNWHSNY
ncbi:MAG: transposase [Nostoc sp.]